MTQQTIPKTPVTPVIPDFALTPEYIGCTLEIAHNAIENDGGIWALTSEREIKRALADAVHIRQGKQHVAGDACGDWVRHITDAGLHHDPIAADPAPIQALATVTPLKPAFVEQDLHWTDVTKCAPGRDWGTYFVKIPGTLARAMKQVDRPEGRIGIRHIRLYGAANLHTENGEGGRGLATNAELARESGWSPRSINKAITKGAPLDDGSPGWGPLAEWVEKTGMTSQGRIIFEMRPLGDDEQWVRIPWWWLWAEATWTTTRATIRPTITDKALTAAIAIQLAVKPAGIKWVNKMAVSASISSYGTQGLATLVGVDERLVKEGLREGRGTGWLLNSNDDVAPEHKGGRSITPTRTVVFHRPAALSVPPSTLSVPPFIR